MKINRLCKNKVEKLRLFMVLSIYYPTFRIVRIETRVFTVDLKERNVSIGGRWQRRCTYDWSSYRGYEIVRSVKDFPEDFYILFQDGSKERKFKLANLTLFLRRYNPTYYDALLDVWESIEDEMKL